MRIKLSCMLCVCLLSSLLSAQSDTTIWKSIIQIEDNRYTIAVPEGWKKVTVTEGSGFDHKYEFTGIGVQQVHNGAPLSANFTISSLQGDRRTEGRDQIVKEFMQLSDRVTEPGYNYDTTSIAVRDSMTGTFLHARYYRRSKVSNYSRYYLIVYNSKLNQTFILALNFQYKDTTYDIERTARFKEYALSIFRRLQFR